MEIRNPYPKEKEQILNLWRYAFHRDSSTFTAHYFARVYQENNTWTLTQEGQIRAALQLNPCHFVWNGESFQVPYVVGISSLPEARSQGAVKSLFTHIFRNLYQEKTPFAVLMAIDYGLYQPYGFSHIQDKILIRGEIKSLGKNRGAGTFTPLLPNYEAEQVRKLTDYYNQLCHNRYPLYRKRSSAHFHTLLKELAADQGYGYLLENDGEIKGYLFYYFDQNTLVVKEMGYSDTQAIQSLLRFIYNHNTQVPHFEIRENQVDPVSLLMPDRRALQISLLPFLMARIIHLPALLETLSFQDIFLSEFRLRIEDSLFQENHKVWKLQNGQPILGESAETAFHLSLPVELFTRLLFGAADQTEVRMLLPEGAIGDKDAAEIFFDRFDRKKPLYFNEYV